MAYAGHVDWRVADMDIAYSAYRKYAVSMRTTLEIPDDLLEEARRATHLRTKREVVIAGLEELVRKAHREDLRRMAGKIELDVDLRRARKKKAR
jgi:Arc/MetJ family transcription regulator